MDSVLQEVFQDSFDPEDFVERIAWRTMLNVSKGGTDDLDPDLLHSTFTKTICDLKEMNIKVQKDAEKYEAECKAEEKKHWMRVSEQQNSIQVSCEHFQALDERINSVATKVVHLGDQLEGVNIPRNRAAEAQKLMNYLAEFLEDEPLRSPIFTEPAQVHQAADIIQKLQLIALELPPGTEFELAQKKIQQKYDEIEKSLRADFISAQHNGDIKNMKKIAATLSHFKGYGQCVDLFVEESQKAAFLHGDIFADILPLCFNANKLILEVFINPEVVMAKFVLNIYINYLHNHIGKRLDNCPKDEKYLVNLYELYQRTLKLSQDLTVYNLGSDSGYLSRLTKNVFCKYLDAYIDTETKFLRDRSVMILSRYYDSEGHQKKQIQSGAIHDLRRDIQAKLGGNINIGPAIETYGGKTFLSLEVATNLIQECKNAFKRCKVLSTTADLPSNATNIFEILVTYLVLEHIDYALELCLQGIPLAEPKTEPEIYFFEVVCQANTLFHLFEKQFSDSLIPLVSSTPKHSECLQRKRELMETMENKMDSGIDKSLQAMIGWIRHILTSEQKKVDFKPESDDAPMQMFSPPCLKVVKYIQVQIERIRESLDGKNVEAVMTELGLRFHRVIYEHLLQYQYNSMGAMLAICDVNEYRKSAKDFKIPLVDQLFDTLHALCNLLVVVPNNLKQVCTGEQLAGLDKMVLQSFVQLRADYKSARLANQFK